MSSQRLQEFGMWIRFKVGLRTQVIADNMIILFLKTKLSMLKSAMPNLAFRRKS
jgi:hypothetical protein